MFSAFNKPTVGSAIALLSLHSLLVHLVSHLRCAAMLLTSARESFKKVEQNNNDQCFEWKSLKQTIPKGI